MSRTTRTNPVLMSLMLAFILTLGAGVVVGMVAGRHGPASAQQQTLSSTTQRADHPGKGNLADALGLNSEQRDKLKQIWTEEMQGPAQRANAERRSQLFKDRDAALYSLLTDEQKQQYQAKMGEFNAKLNELNKEREKSIQDGIEKTKAILDDKQREKYEQLLKEHGGMPHGEHGDHGERSQRGGPHGPRRGGGPQWFGEPGTQPFRNGPTTNEFKDSDNKESYFPGPGTRPT